MVVRFPRVVSSADVETITGECGLMSLEVSAKTGGNINSIFDSVGRLLLSTQEPSPVAKENTGTTFPNF